MLLESKGDFNMRLILAILIFVSVNASAAVFQGNTNQLKVDLVELRLPDIADGANYIIKVTFEGQTLLEERYKTADEPREIYNRYFQAQIENVDIYFDTDKDLLEGFKVVTRNFTCPQ